MDITVGDTTVDVQAGQVFIHVPGLDTTNSRNAQVLAQTATRLQMALYTSPLIVDGVILPELRPEPLAQLPVS